MKNINDVINGVDEVINNAKQGNFDEIISKTKSYAQRATRRSAERLEISRKKIELLDTKTKLSKAYEKLGKLTYAIDEGEEVNADDLASCRAEIQLQKMRSDLLNKEIEELKAIFVSNEKSEKSDVQSAAADVETVVVEPSDE